MKKGGKIFSFLISFFILLFVFFLRLMRSDFLQRVDLQFVDLFFKIRGRVPADEKVVIVAIDERSLEHLGRWPWKRSIIAQGIKKIEEGNPKVIGLDIVFAEPDPSFEREIVEYAFDEVKKSINEVQGKFQVDKDRLNENLKELLNSLQVMEKNLPYSLKFSAKRMEEDLISLKKSFEEFGIYEGIIKNLADRFDNYSLKINQDFILRETIKQYKNIVLGYFFYTEEIEAKSVDKEKLKILDQYTLKSKIPVVVVKDKTMVNYIPSALALRSNIEQISEVAEHFGFFNAIPDADGVYRQGLLVAKYEDYYLPSLSLEMVRTGLDSSLKLKALTNGLFIEIGDLEVPLTDDGKMIINYRGPGGSFKTLSFYDVLRGTIKSEFFKDKYVLIGATATAIFDLRPTPFQKVYPGVETHANIIDNILNKRYLKQNIYTYMVEILSMVLLWFIVTVSITRFSSYMGVTIFIITLSTYSGLSYFLFIKKYYLLSVLYPTMVSSLSFGILLSLKLFTEERTRKKYREAFQRYVSASVVEEILKDPSKLKLGGEKKNLTVLFSDIRGFTAVSESLDPVIVAEILHEFLTPMTEIIFENMGMLDKYMGDAIMAVFGAPLYREDHAELACRSAVQMMKRLPLVNEDFRKRNIPPIDIGIGINSGEMVVGNMGSKMLFDYTVVGDNVNLGSRLEALNKIYGTNIIVSEFTKNQIKNSEEFIFRPLDLVRVKGKLRPVRIYEIPVKNIDRETLSEAVRLFEKGLNYYFNREWDMAIPFFESVIKILKNDEPSSIFIERCNYFKVNPPPPDWDGVFEARIK